MAVAPLFVADMTVLKKALRLDGAAAAAALAIIDTAVQKARVGFYNELGASRVAAILAITAVDNPTTDDQVMRAQAIVAEIVWVKYHLLCDLPTIFLDGSSHIQEEWNQEGLARHMSGSELNAARDAAYAELLSYLDILKGNDVPAESAVNVESIGPVCRNRPPEHRVFPQGHGPHNFFGNRRDC